MSFRSTPHSCPPPSLRQSMTVPAPWKTGAVSGSTPNNAHRRRCSSIPRPTSKLTAARITPAAAAVAVTSGGNQAGEVDTTQTIVKPRTYSQTRRKSVCANQIDHLNPLNTRHERPPRLSLPAPTSQRVDFSNDVSRIRKYSPRSCYSRRHLASLDSVISSPTRKEENIGIPLHAFLSRRSEINNTSSFPVTKFGWSVSPHRQLMRPLGPPVPRSQTMGALIPSVDMVPNTPLPPKSTTCKIRVGQRTGVGEVGAMDGVVENTGTNKETEYRNKAAKDVEANCRGLEGHNRDIPMSSDKMGEVSTRPQPSSSQFTLGYSDVILGDSSKKSPFQQTNPENMANFSSSVSSSNVKPEPAVNTTFDRDRAEGSRTRVKYVYLHEPIQYWRGRFSTFSDRLRSEDYFLNTTYPASTATTTGATRSLTPKKDRSECFELDDIRRNVLALQELRSCCRTADALRSFEDFAPEVRTKHTQESAAKRRPPICTSSPRSKARLLAAEFRSKAFRAENNMPVATINMASSKPRPRPSMTRSRTTGDVIQVTQAASSGIKGRGAQVGWRRPSYLKAQEEVMASEIALSAERQAKAVPASQGHATGSDMGLGITNTAGISATGMTLPPATKSAGRHSLARQRSGSSVEMSIGADMLKRVFSGSVRGVRRIGRSLNGMSGSGDG